MTKEQYLEEMSSMGFELYFIDQVCIEHTYRYSDNEYLHVVALAYETHDLYAWIDLGSENCFDCFDTSGPGYHKKFCTDNGCKIQPEESFDNIIKYLNNA